MLPDRLHASPRRSERGNVSTVNVWSYVSVVDSSTAICDQSGTNQRRTEQVKSMTNIRWDNVAQINGNTTQQIYLVIN